VNQPDINASALPGGPMFLNRGMLRAHRRRGRRCDGARAEPRRLAARNASGRESTKVPAGCACGTSA
jgi:predicted Zn-dependent protease